MDFEEAKEKVSKILESYNISNKELEYKLSIILLRAYKEGLYGIRDRSED